MAEVNLWFLTFMMVPIFAMTIFAWLLATPQNVQVQAVWDRLGALTPDAIRKGQVWRLLTHSLLHSNFMHLFGNSVSMIVAYMMLRSWNMSNAWYFTIHYVSVIYGGVASLALGPKEQMGVGASGGVYGLFGAWFVLLMNNWEHVHGPTVRNFIIQWVVSQILVVVFSTRSVNHIAHAFGFISGAVLAFGYLQEKFPSQTGKIASPIGSSIVLLTMFIAFVVRAKTR